jgi:hypothetical protein
MAVITPDTFNALRRYVGVRLQQGVPLVDADWNELDDIRRFELRAFVKWFVGDGVPEGTNGYRIEGTGLSSDFFIRSGVTGTANALSNIGRCLVDGLDVMIDTDVRFADQPLFVNKAGAPTLATGLGVPPIQPMPAPAANSTVVAYLDVWERLVTPTEDPTLVLAGLGTESCARLKREWAVRVRGGTSLPVPGNTDFLAGHSYYALATIARSAATVNAADVTDLRERRLLMPPATLIPDAFGTTPTEYRRGLNRPAVSLREAINALMRDAVPGTPETAIAPGPGNDTSNRSFLLDNANGLIAIWDSTRAGNSQVFAARLDLNNLSAGFSTPQQITSGSAKVTSHAALLPNGDLMVAYQDTTQSDVKLKRAPFDGLSSAPEVVVAGTPGIFEGSPFILVVGDIAVIYFLQGPAPGGQGNRLLFKRRRLSDNTFMDGSSSIQLSPTSALSDFHAVQAAGGFAFTVFKAQNNDIRTVRHAPATNVFLGEDSHNAAATLPDVPPFLLPTSNGDVLLFWTADNGLVTRRFHGSAWGQVESVPNTTTGFGTTNDRQPCAVEDPDGSVRLFWTRGPFGSADIVMARREGASDLWDRLRFAAGGPGDNSASFALLDPNDVPWLFWSSTRTGNPDIFVKRIFTTI